ncbi:MAG: hypothetical protein NT129_05665 [Candidatus Aenigmarchaeota archaeon]|nr:hypothetical protein [Candidatus Aenigmarchaeota archaeon]
MPNRFELLKSMIKEEWRIHSVLIGGKMFVLFPVMLVVLAFLGSLFLPIINIVLPLKQFVVIVHYVFVLFGVSVGSFGLLGKEVMNRRFGQASLIAYSSRTLPVSEKRIFVNFFVKDIIYYFLLWIIPFVLGFAIASPLLSIGLNYSSILLITLTLSFLIGLSIVFLLSTVYAHSSRLLIAMLTIAAVALFALNYLKISLLYMLPSLSFFFMPSYVQLVACLLIILIPISLSMIFLKIDYPEKKKRFRNSLAVLTNLLAFSKYSTFISKDFLDLMRSEGGLGKIIFSFIFPIAIIWPMLLIFLKFIPVANFLMIFSVLLGAISSTIYNWLTEFDLFTSYSFLPVRISTLIKSKLRGYAIINLVSISILILAALLSGQINYFIPSFFAFLVTSIYTVAVTIYLTGLNSNILMYNAKIFLAYIASASPIMLVLMFASIINPNILLISPALLPLCYYLIKKGYDKWDSKDYMSF